MYDYEERINYDYEPGGKHYNKKKAIKKRIKVINPDTYVFTFGKYKGETFEHVAYINPRYVRWCIQNVEWFKVDKETEADILEEASREDCNYGGTGEGGELWGLFPIGIDDFMGW